MMKWKISLIFLLSILLAPSLLASNFSDDIAVQHHLDQQHTATVIALIINSTAQHLAEGATVYFEPSAAHAFSTRAVPFGTFLMNGTGTNASVLFMYSSRILHAKKDYVLPQRMISEMEKESGIARLEVQKTYDAFLNTIVERSINEGSVKIEGFGTFTMDEVPGFQERARKKVISAVSGFRLTFIADDAFVEHISSTNVSVSHSFTFAKRKPLSYTYTIMLPDETLQKRSERLCSKGIKKFCA